MTDVTRPGVDRLAAALADRYRIERELGAGGMATVYLAHDLKHDRQVAVKVLRPELAAVIGADRFLAEIRTTANLQHPHILPLFDSGTADGAVFYVMPYVQGETVRDRLNREKQLAIADAVRIATEVAGALDYAHRRGIIHRDIKPENILLHDGSALVADFGIALAAAKAGDSRMTETGMSLGTPHYMSPEQALGERDITARTDVYALGCVLYEMLLGEPPFTGPTAQSIVAKVMSEKPALLIPRRDRVPPEVQDAVLTALEKLPADRFATAAEFSAALRAPTGTPARRTAPAGSATRWLGWRLAAVALLAGLVLGAGAMAAARPWADAGSAFSSGGRSQLTFNGRSARPAISPDGEYIAYVDLLCPRGIFNSCVTSLFMQARGSDRPVPLLRDVPALSAPRFTADGTALVVSAQLDAGRSGLFVMPRLGGVPRRIGPSGVFDVHARADSAVLVTVGPQRTAVAHFIDIASGMARDSVLLPAGGVDAIAWSPDGRFLALVEEYSRLTIMRRNGAIVDSVRGPFRVTVRWAPDGDGVLLFRALPVKEDDLVFHGVGRDGRFDGAPQVRLAATQTLLRGEFDIARGTGKLVLATGSGTWDLWTFELDNQGPARQRTSGTTWYGIPSISPDGTQLFYLRGDAIGDNLYALTLPDAEEALTAESDPGAGGARVAPDGQRVLFGHASASGYRFGTLDLVSRQTTYADGLGFNSDLPPTLTGQGVVFLATAYNGLGLLDGAGVRRVLFTLPDSLRLSGFVVNPAADSAAVIVVSAQRRLLARTPLDRWDPQWLHAFAADEFSRYLSWDRRGAIQFWLWQRGDDAPGLWQVRSTAGAAVRRMVLPAACNIAEVDIAIDADRGVCRAEDIRSDIWLIDLPRVSR